MNLTEIIQSSGWKKFMAKLYGFGASVVIIGAMFKIMHWPGGGLMIVVGLGTEAIIFFFSAFEPLHEELDWTMVYPELAGMSDPDEMEHFKEELPAEKEKEVTKIEDLIGETGINPDAMKKLSEGFERLNQSVDNISDITAATVATKQYYENMQNAAQAMGDLNETYNATNESMKDSIGQLSQSYIDAASSISKSGQSIAQSYENLAQNIQSEHSQIEEGNKAYGEQMEALNSKLSALNAAYELQLQSTNENLKDTSELYKGMGDMVSNLKESIDETNKYKDEMSKLSENIASLNSIYGNMLSAMHTNKK